MKKINLLSKLFTMAAVICISSSLYAQCPANMTSYWRMQETGGSIFADEKNNHDAIASASPSQTAGISGKSQLFGGSNYLSVPSHADFNWASNGSYSIELWVKYLVAGPGVHVIIGRDDPTTQTHWWIGKNSDGKIEWYTRSSDGSIGDIEATANTNDGQWHHVVAVRGGGKNFLYIDGVLQNAGGTTVTLGGSLASTADITIGNMIYNNSPMYYYTGAIDEVAIYNAALSAADVTNHYNNIRNYQIGYCSSNEPELLSEPNTSAVITQLYNYDIDASGNPVPTYSIVQGPAGMTINATSGVISWTPLSFSQNAPVIVRATNSLGSADQQYNIFLADAPECRSNLIAFWDFNTPGVIPFIDNVSGYSLTGAGPAQTTGRLGLGLAFDGVNDSLNLKDNAEPVGKIFFDFDDVPNFSIELWMKSNATPAQTMVLVGRDENANNSQFWLGVNPDGTVGLTLREYTEPADVLALEGGSVLDGAWHHIVATYNASTDRGELYVDKNLVDETTQHLLNMGGDDPMNVGCLNTPIDKFWFNGQMDELAFYNVALNSSSISNNYDAAVNGQGACVLNFAPLVLSSPVTTVNEDVAYNYQLVASEINAGDVLTISAVTKPSWLTLTFNAGDSTAILNGTPDNSHVGLHNVTLRVTDGSINVDQTFQVEVINVNDPPTFTSNPVASVNEDTEYLYTVVAADIDADANLVYSGTLVPDWMTFDSETKVLSGTPENDQVGLWNVVLSVTDGTVTIDQDFQISVINVNDSPVIITEEVDSVQATVAYLYEIIATDVDADDIIVYSAESIPSWLTFTAGANSGILSGTPDATDIGTYAIILKVNDGHTDVMQGFSLVVTAAPVGVQEIDNSIIHKVFPVPSSHIVYFRFAEQKNCKVQLFDLNGKLQKHVVSENGQIDMNISDLANGIYLYKAFQNDKLSIGRLTKE
jgi:hypothetical protein